jgi:AraC-like DNA-binding protein
MEMRHHTAIIYPELKNQSAGYTFTTTRYDHFQVIYITEGTVHFRSSGVEQALTAGCGLVLKIGSTFQISCRVVGYRGVGMNLYDPTVQAYHGPAVAFQGDVWLHEIACRMQQEMDRPDFGTEHMLTGLGTLLCWQALRAAGTSTHVPHSAGDWAERARQAILATLTTGQCVRAVLAALPLSYRQLARHFSAQFGMSPKQYQQQCRLDEIMRLLRETTISVTTLAHDFGFPSSQHLNAQFRRATGVTPLAYRQMQRAED